MQIKAWIWQNRVPLPSFDLSSILSQELGPFTAKRLTQALTERAYESFETYWPCRGIFIFVEFGLVYTDGSHRVQYLSVPPRYRQIIVFLYPFSLRLKGTFKGKHPLNEVTACVQCLRKTIIFGRWNNTFSLGHGEKKKKTCEISCTKIYAHSIRLYEIKFRFKKCQPFSRLGSILESYPYWMFVIKSSCKSWSYLWNCWVLSNKQTDCMKQLFLTLLIV